MLFVIVLGTALYLLVFAVAALVGKSESHPHTGNYNRMLVLIPAYKEDFVIESTVRSFLRQSYPSSQFDVVVIADHCQQDTVDRLSQYPITVLTPNFEESLKAKSLKYAMDCIAPRKYDIVVILDADNTVDASFLHVINDCYEAGSMAIQAHRVAKNRNTETALLDAIFEEINNTIFRKMIESDVIRDQFLTRLGVIFQTLTTELMQQELETAAALVEPELQRHYARWAQYKEKAINIDSPTTMEGYLRYWETRVNRMKDTMTRRPYLFWGFVQNQFGLTNEQMIYYFGARPANPDAEN